MPSQLPPRIQSLPERLANQIAAGEVVERPASVLKELLENSLDAGAKHISVDIEHGGGRLIRVRDDGVGIHREDLVLALGRHATSKIASLEDLENVASLGFRGEALPSIASVSRLELSSCPAGAPSGWKLSGENRGAHTAPQPSPHPQGTTVAVRDLFYNTPARRKFLRTERTEYRHLEDVLKRAALSRFECAFSLRHNGRESYSLAGATNDAERARRVAKLCGAAFMDQALALSFEAADLQLGGWTGGPGYSRAVSDLQYFFVNGRMVRDHLLRHAVRHAHAQAHHGIVESGRQPAYVLFLRIKPSQVDVNVHPSKHEVRFRDARSVHDFVVRSLRQALTTQTDFTDQAPGNEVFSPVPPPASGPGAVLGSPPPRGDLREYAPAYGALRKRTLESGPAAIGGPLGEALQHIDRRYLLTRNDRGVVVVDVRHACRYVAARHLAAGLDNGAITSRPLLVPVAVNVDEHTADLLEGRAKFLEALGFDLRRVAHACVSCRGIPAPLATASPQELLLCAADALSRMDPSLDSANASSALLDALLEGCDLTVGWPWDHDAMNDLLRQLERLQIASQAQEGEIIWRQIDADDIRTLLGRRRP